MLVLADLKMGTCKALVPSGLETLPDKHAVCQALDESELHEGKRCPGTLVMDTECFFCRGFMLVLVRVHLRAAASREFTGFPDNRLQISVVRLGCSKP